MAAMLKNQLMFASAVVGRFPLFDKLSVSRREIRDLFGGFHIKPARLKYAVAARLAKDVQELVILDRSIQTGLF